MRTNFEAIDRQNQEFDALTDLTDQWKKLRNIAVVDDDYPQQRAHYEAALRSFINALRMNKRLSGLSLTMLRVVSVQRCETGFKHSLGSWSVAEWGNATAGECGEACNVAKKMLRFRDNVTGNAEGMTRDDYKKQLASEIAGMVIYADLWAASEGIDLGEAIIDEFNTKSDQIGSTIKL